MMYEEDEHVVERFDFNGLECCLKYYVPGRNAIAMAPVFGMMGAPLTLGGHFCGYVKVPEGHPAHGVDYEEDLVYEMEVHGDVTFSSWDGDDWILGFDTAHGTTFDKEEAILETHKLAQEILDAAC